MEENKCVICGTSITGEYEYYVHLEDDEEVLYCMPCAETESDTGEIY